MDTEEAGRSAASIGVENIGGIEEASVEFSPGITILAGRNATNRTSLLRAIMAACGSDDVTIKADADEARAELTIGDETYTRTLTRHDDAVTTSGDPYLDDPTLADLFAFLLESNETRRAVARDVDLRGLIMRPIDTEEIEAEIERFRREREDLEAELEEIEEFKGRLPELEERRTTLREQIEAKREGLEEAESALEASDVDVEETREEKAELERRLDELRNKRSALEDVRYDLDTERESLDALREQRRELEAELDELPETPVGDVDELESRIERLRSRKQERESEISELRSVIQFNEDMLADTDHEVGEAFSDGGTNAAGSDPEALTEQLLDDDVVTCWTCGSEIERDRIRATVDRLRELSQEKLARVNDIQDELDELTEKRRSLREKQRERERIERRLATLEDELEESEARIETLQDRRDTLTDEVAAVEAEVEQLENEAYSELLELHREANQLEYELGKLEGDLDDLEDEIATIEMRIDEQEALEAERDRVEERIDELRTYIDRVEAQAVEEFNGHMETVLDLLDYENLERIWLERVDREVRQGRRTVEETTFTLHVVRTTESGAAYEDTVEHLSESEREVTGLVFALAGYLAHDVHEDVPFVLLDSLEAIDSERIAGLIDHFGEYSEYLIVALLPEDARALSGEYERVPATDLGS